MKIRPNPQYQKWKKVLEDLKKNNNMKTQNITILYHDDEAAEEETKIDYLNVAFLENQIFFFSLLFF